jgi:hypothetical protein
MKIKIGINERNEKQHIECNGINGSLFGVRRTNIDLSQAVSTYMEDIVSNDAIVAICSVTRAKHGLAFKSRNP